MDYEKMWKTLRWQLMVKIGELMIHTNEYNKSYKKFSINIIEGIIKIMDEIEKFNVALAFAD